MSQENVEIVRRALDGWASAGYDMRKVEDFFAVADPGIEFDISRTNPDSEVYRGREGMIAALEQWVETWDDYEVQALEVIDAGPERVVTVIRERGKLKHSDAWVEHTRGAVWTIRDQKVVRYEEYQDRQGALDAVGVPG